MFDRAQGAVELNGAVGDHVRYGAPVRTLSMLVRYQRERARAVDGDAVDGDAVDGGTFAGEAQPVAGAGR